MQIAALLLQRDAALAEAGVAGLGHGDVALQHDLGARGHLQHQAVLAGLRVHQLGAAAAQQAGELVLAQRVGHRRDGAQRRRRVGAQGAHQRERLAGVGARELAEVERAAAVGQPAHDQLAPADHLLAVDAQVLAQARLGHVARAARDDQAPGDQRGDVAGPAGLDRPLREVDLVGRLDHLLARAAAQHGGLHVPQRLAHGPQLAGVLDRLGRLRLAQVGQQLADAAQLGDVGRAHPERDAVGGPEQVGEHRHADTRWGFRTAAPGPPGAARGRPVRSFRGWGTPALLHG